MIYARIKQGLNFIFIKYDSRNDFEVKKELSEDEFKIFNMMSNYEKVHSFRLYKLVLKDNLLKELAEYRKLALLHDCGKDSPSLFKRIKKVLIGDKILENHPLVSFKKLEKINEKVAFLSKIHHDRVEDIYMKRFQELDDK